MNADAERLRVYAPLGRGHRVEAPELIHDDDRGTA